MDLPRIGRRTIRFSATATNSQGQSVPVTSAVIALMPVGRRPKSTTVFTPPTSFENDETVVVANGPEAPPFEGAITIARDCDLYVKTETQDGIDADFVLTIRLT